MERLNNKELEYTDNAWQSVYHVAEEGCFSENEADVIFEELMKNMRVVPFGEYLKRYLYQKNSMTEPFHHVELQTFQKIILDSFTATKTPASFFPTTAKLSALSKNWLTQMSVRRNVVLLLGFGLSMGVGEVNDLLRKGLKEQGINAKDPFEVICWYCYKNGYGFEKYQELWDHFMKMDPDFALRGSLLNEQTVHLRSSLLSIRDEDSLFSVLAGLKTKDNQSRFSVSARKCFDRLYKESRVLIAAMYNDSDSARAKTYTAEDITAADLEHVIYASVPVDKNGNLIPEKESKLTGQFQGKRLSRKTISDILTKKKEVSRFDLITLNFFIYSQRVEEFSTICSRYKDFVESTNGILEECYLEPIYTANPYESFVLMCILAEDPLLTYADVVGMSYGQERAER